jgi:hypothetical protein
MNIITITLDNGTTLTNIVADEYKILTNGEVYSPAIYLADGDHVENWFEIPEEE